MRHLGRYRLDEQLGSGAFATVWKGFDPELDSVVAVKVLAENWATNADVCERFLAEARLLRRISHPAVVRVHDVGTARGDDGVERPYFVMDHVAGGTLASRVGTLAPSEAPRAGGGGGRGGAGAARRGRGAPRHQAEQPAGRPGRATQRVLVADLGSAKLLAEASTLTVVAGTPAYMAPEQAMSSGGFDGRADVYAMGAVTYQLLSGRLPYDSDSPVAVLTRPDVAPPRSRPRSGCPASSTRCSPTRWPRTPVPASRPVQPSPRHCGTWPTGVRSPCPDAALGGRWPAAAVAVLAAVVFLAAASVAWLVS